MFMSLTFPETYNLNKNVKEEYKNDLMRYSRQIAIEEIGVEGQLKLRDAKIGIIGCGALGSMVSMQLAGAGVGKIKIADYDTVDITNLQRQFFFSTDEAGKSKAEIMARQMKQLNPEITVEVTKSMIHNTNGEDFIADCDFIIDATDNPSSKILIDNLCSKNGIPCCIGGVAGFHGQVTTLISPGERFSILFPESEEGGFMPCSLGGVIGPAAALCASIQSSETIKYIVEIGELLKNRLFTFDLLNNNFRVFEY